MWLSTHDRVFDSVHDAFKLTSDVLVVISNGRGSSYGSKVRSGSRPEIFVRCFDDAAYSPCQLCAFKSAVHVVVFRS